jgi:hypothetical protein
MNFGILTMVPMSVLVDPRLHFTVHLSSFLDPKKGGVGFNCHQPWVK